MTGRINKHLIYAIYLVGFLFILILHFWSLMRYPAPFVDEAWLTSRAWAFLHTGHQLGSLDMGVAENLPGGWVANQWLITALQSICLRNCGTTQSVCGSSSFARLGCVADSSNFSDWTSDIFQSNCTIRRYVTRLLHIIFLFSSLCTI